jgi:FlaG/FlaF family flagellin (archaellin)
MDPISIGLSILSSLFGGKKTTPTPTPKAQGQLDRRTSDAERSLNAAGALSGFGPNFQSTVGSASIQDSGGSGLPNGATVASPLSTGSGVVSSGRK